MQPKCCPQCGAELKVEQSEWKLRMQCVDCGRYERIEMVVYTAPQAETSVSGQVKAAG